MSDDYDYEDDYEPVPEERPRDRKIDDAKAALMEAYFAGGANVYYARQLEIWLEKTFFHWITSRALRELAEERKIGFSEATSGTHRAHFYFPIRHRYPRRQITQTLKLIAEFSHPVFTRALGRHGEMLVESGFARTGFRILQQKVKEVDGQAWTETNHDLDFLIVRDGIRYGVEVKNQLGYIDQTEFQTKLAMCEHFGVRPMFVTRALPKNYIYEVAKAGGFSLLTDNQNYPLLAGDLARRVRAALNLPVGVIEQFPNTALVRFERWHEEQAAGEGSV
jgi:hypothetical protein